MNTAIVCRKITQQGKLFWLEEKENQFFSGLKAQNFSSYLTQSLGAALTEAGVLYSGH